MTTRIQGFVWRVPEWWVWVLILTSWVLLGIGVTTAGGSPAHAGHSHGAAPAVTSLASPSDVYGVFAMMGPLVLPTLRRTALASLWHRRQQAMVECLVGYLLIWVVSALVVGVVIHQIATLVGQPLLIGFVLLAVLVWQRTAVKRRALRACHTMLPLAPRGWRADRDCLGFGVTVGVNCVINCLPLMALAAASDHQLLAVFAISVALVLERFGRHAVVDTARAIAIEVERGAGGGSVAAMTQRPARFRTRGGGPASRLANPP